MKALLIFALACGVSLAGPLTGSYPNKNGGGDYTFKTNGANVFVFHHFGVEVC